LCSLLVAASGCGDDTKPATPDSGTNPDSATPDGGGTNFPAAPTVGAQIDRIGRPGINTALTDPFWNDGTASGTLANHELEQDTYNHSADPAAWSTENLANFKAKLGVYDALDGTCGNQAAAGAAGPDRYTMLASLLADDKLY